MNNLFIDIGTHMGGGILSFIKKYNMSSHDWIIHTFEPHPNLFKVGGENNYETQIGYPYSFKDLNESLDLIPQIHRHNVACSDFDGEVDFYFDKNLEENHMGNTIIKNIYENPILKNYDKNRSSYINPPIKVKCINIYNFIQDILDKQLINQLVIKIDAEGAEFSILNNFLSVKQEKIFNVNHCDIYCEFHHFILNNPNDYPSFEFYRDSLKEKNINLYQWG